MNSYHDIRSIRSWLNALYPDVDILVQRNQQQKSKKSYFLIQDARERYEDAGRAYFNTLRTVNIHLITEGKSATSPSDDTYWKTSQVVSFLRDKLLRDRVVPQFIFNEGWYPPVCWTKPGGALTGGTYEFAATSVDRYDKESLISQPVEVVVTTGQKLFMALTLWPRGHPLNKGHVIYRRTAPDQPWKAILEVPTVLSDQGSQVVEVTDLSFLAPDRNPPTSSKQYMGHLKVDMATSSIFESNLTDDAFHGMVAVTFRSRAPQKFRSFAPVNSVGTEITVG